MNKPSTSKIVLSLLVDTWKPLIDIFKRLLIATPLGDDAITLLVAAATNFVPINREIPCPCEDLKTIPQPSGRPSIDQVISEIETSNWYIDQIVDRHTIEAKEAQNGIVTTINLDTTINLVSRIFAPPYVTNDIERCFILT